MNHHTIFTNEPQLHDRTSWLEALFDNSPDMIDVIDPEGTLLDVNRRFCEELGYHEDDLIGQPIWTIDQTVEAEDVKALLADFKPGERRQFEGRYERADGSAVPVEVHLLRLNLDEVDRFIAISRDITERKKEAQQIRALHDTAREILQAETPERVAQVMVDAVDEILDMPINGVYYHERSGTVLRPVAWTQCGEEVVVDIPTFQRGESLAWDVFEAGEASLYDDVSAEPGRLNPDTPIRSEMIVPLGDYGIAMVGSLEVGAFSTVDISLMETLATHAETALERISREQDLEESEARYRSLTDDVLDTSQIGTFILDSDFEVDWITEATEEFFGINRSDVIGADKRGLITEHIKYIFEDSKTFADTVLATYDDNTYVEEFECHVLPGEHLEERWLAHWSQPIDSGLYEGGRIEHYTDITERKRKEEELQTQNERLDEFASVVSHDLRNPLGVAKGRLELAMEEFDSEHLDAVERSHGRMTALIDDLLTLAREGLSVKELERVDLARLAENCWHNVETTEATLHVNLDRVLKADRSRLQQLLENLMRNAVEHGGETVTISIGEVDDGFYLEDDGDGISAEKRADVFDAGYSMSEEGTGFGLSIVKQIVAAHGWDIRVTEGIEGGARFEITGIEFGQ